MLAPEGFQRLPRRPHPAFLDILLAFVHSRGDVQEPLIGFRVLNDCLRFAVDGKHQRLLGFLEMFHELPGIPPEVVIA